MKALYLSPVGRKVELLDLSDVTAHFVIDFDPIRRSIANGIRARFPSLELTELIDLAPNDADSFDVDLNGYELLICDLSTSNANILHLTGRAEATSKPTIYILNNESPHPWVLEHRQILYYSVASIEKEFQDELHSAIDGALKDPSKVLSPIAKQKKKPKVFISYSHLDKAYLERLHVHLKPVVRMGQLDVWVDTNIKAGDRWRESIQAALENSSIAILLISADFLASDFIVDNELPPLLARAEVNGTRIIPVILSPCRFARDSNLSRFQSVNPPTEPLSLMKLDDREAIYDKLTQDIEKAIEPI